MTAHLVASCKVHTNNPQPTTNNNKRNNNNNNNNNNSTSTCRIASLRAWDGPTWCLADGIEICLFVVLHKVLKFLPFRLNLQLLELLTAQQIP